MTTAASEPEHDIVVVEVPGGSKYLRLLRLAAADAATRAEFDMDETDDLRIAVDELCHALTGGSDARVRLEVDAGDHDVVVRGRCESSTPPVLSDLARTILGAVVDSYSLEYVDGHREFIARKACIR